MAQGSRYLFRYREVSLQANAVTSMRWRWSTIPPTRNGISTVSPSQRMRRPWCPTLNYSKASGCEHACDGSITTNPSTAPSNVHLGACGQIPKRQALRSAAPRLIARSPGPAAGASRLRMPRHVNFDLPTRLPEAYPESPLNRLSIQELPRKTLYVVEYLFDGLGVLLHGIALELGVRGRQPLSHAPTAHDSE